MNSWSNCVFGPNEGIYKLIGTNNGNLISYLVSFSYEMGTVTTRYDFLEARRMTLSNVEPIPTFVLT